MEELRGCVCVCVRVVRAALASSTGAQEDIWHDCKRRSDREMKAAEVTFRGYQRCLLLVRIQMKLWLRSAASQ